MWTLDYSFAPRRLSLQDPYGRNIDYLRLSVTDRCNLRCRYCMPPHGVPERQHADILRYEELLRVAAAACRLGVRKIRVTGGEPLVRRGLTGFIAGLAALPEQPEIALTTNGLLLAESAAALRQAGLRRVNVSLDTLKPERFRQITGSDGLDRVLAGIRAAEAVDLVPIKLNVIPFRHINRDELLDFARLTLEHDWDIRFIEFMPISSDLEFSSSDGLPMHEVETLLHSLGPLQALPQRAAAGPARMFRLPDARGRIGLIPSVSGHFCAECNRLRVTADGRVRGCLFDNHEIDLKAVLRHGGDDTALEELLGRAISGKPERHCIGSEAFRQPSRRMHGIGG
ncbi:MAG: GTP 3',8-cyclase MoaA [Desulfuromonadales bacterium]|nr:GTP 3',8-cyclase MoaA [Desulfuromonadales bacterium]